MIYSRPRCGYFVSHPKETFTLSPSEELQHSNMNFKEIKIIQPDQELCRLLRLTPENLVILITRVNSLAGETAGVEYKYMPYEKGSPSIEEEINYAVFPDPAIEKSYSFNYYTEVEVQAATARGEVLSLLRCEEHEPLLQISRLFITQDDQYIAYSKQYLRASCGILRGISGYVHKNGKNRKDCPNETDQISDSDPAAGPVSIRVSEADRRLFHLKDILPFKYSGHHPDLRFRG